MKNKVFINFNFEIYAYYFLHEYIESVGEKPNMYNGKSARKTYSATHAKYQVVCWQTKKNIYCEVVR